MSVIMVRRVDQCHPNNFVSDYTLCIFCGAYMLSFGRRKLFCSHTAPFGWSLPWFQRMSSWPQQHDHTHRTGAQGTIPAISQK